MRITRPRTWLAQPINIQSCDQRPSGTPTTHPQNVSLHFSSLAFFSELTWDYKGVKVKGVLVTFLWLATVLRDVVLND